MLAVPAGAPRGLYEGHHYIMPRVGFAYSPRKFNYGPATFDRRHVFALTYTYALRMFSRARTIVLKLR